MVRKVEKAMKGIRDGSLQIDWERLIMSEIEDMPRDVVAGTYAILMQRGHRNWRPINEAIIKRWSVSGLEYIKRRAHKKCAEAK